MPPPPVIAARTKCLIQNTVHHVAWIIALPHRAFTSCSNFTR